eukprot:scaffold7066_cov253-Pinguiococcus_pyrenoidosus.AAC.49
MLSIAVPCIPHDPRAVIARSQHVEQRGLAGATGAHEGHELPGAEVELHGPQQRLLHALLAQPSPVVGGLDEHAEAQVSRGEIHALRAAVELLLVHVGVVQRAVVIRRPCTARAGVGSGREARKAGETYLRSSFRASPERKIPMHPLRPPPRSRRPTARDAGSSASRRPSPARERREGAGDGVPV